MSTENRGRLAWTLAITSIAFFMVALDALVVTTALPVIGRDLHAGIQTLQWTVNTYGLTYAAGIVTAAALGDRYGRRRVFMAGLVLFTIASACCALAPTTTALLAARTVQGIAAAAVMPLSLTILTHVFPAQRRGAIVGIWGGIGGLAVAGGPLIGGVITEGLDWHWIFWLNVPIGLVVVVLCRLRLPESRGQAVRLDVPGLVLLAAGVFGVVFGLVQASSVGWGSVTTLIALGLGAALVAGFVVWEGHTATPMLPLWLLRIRDVAAANASALLMNATVTSAVFLVAQYCQSMLHYSPLGTGLRLLPWTAMPLLVAPLAGRLSDRIGRRPVLATGLLLQGLGLGWLALVATNDANYTDMVLPLLIAGIGISMALPTAATAAMSAVAPQDLGKASGTASTLQRLGAVLGVAIVTTVLTATGGSATPAALGTGFRPALAVSAGLSLLGVCSALALRRRRATAVPASRPERELVGMAD